MENGESPRRVAYKNETQAGGPGWLGRSLAVVLSVIVLVAAAMLSLILLAILFGVGTIVVGYLWWKTRALRRAPRAFGDDGRTVDMEIFHENASDDDPARR
ncbi:hypothetical protein AWB73_01414 [Caballeronia turbans]|jgi:hypothetical protein|uniref:hypothetical protein n=1 Tax=unclassified Caballeronia TaxID=2646786 RepID=UPI00074C2020|nr:MULTISPECIES: hypothetical protein [unclassified Caballeronia]SAL21490.1 hypothetical protein AWB73_01414 [Caballeronia turbans]